jgi:acetoacetyl-CoA synthetase
MPMFVSLHDGADGAAAAEAVLRAIRTSLSPRYVPDDVFVVSGIPHTRIGKKLEVPVRELLLGRPLDKVVDVDAVDVEIRDVARRSGG